MEVYAKLSNLRIAPRKTRLVVDMVRGKDLKTAQAILRFVSKKAAIPVLKLINQAEANAKNNLKLDPANLFVAKITVNEGQKLKRWRPRAHGQAFRIQKKTCHINVVLDEIKKSGKKKKAAAATVKEETPLEIKKSVETPKAKQEFKDMFKTPKKGGGGTVKKVFRRQVFAK
jgi:large subunit ribosomal protein L22